MTAKKKQKSSGLKVLGVLSLIGGSIALILSVLAIIPGINIVRVLALFPAIGVFLVPGGIGPVFPHILIIIFYAISILGVIMMLQLKKNGFTLYTVAQIFIFITATIFNFGFLSLIFSLAATILFILLYSKKMQQIS